MTSSSKSVRTTQDKPATSMAELMARHGDKLNTFTKGQEVEGVVTVLTSSDIFIRVANKTDLLVMEKDRKLHKQLLSMLKVGDRVKAVVLYPESDSGYPMVTLRNFMEQKTWDYLENEAKKAEKLQVTVTDTTRGGLVVETDNGVSGFLPNSHMSANQKPDELLGQKITVHIAELQKDTKKVVFSQKGSLSADDFKKLAHQYKSGTKVTGTVSGITTFGIFVSLPFTTSDGEKITVDGLVHISEVSWEKVGDLHELFISGQEVEAVVIGSDPRSKRIDLSIKRLSADPFQAILEAFPAEKKVSGTVSEMTDLGVVLDLGEVDGVAVEGLIKKDKIPAATTYEKGQKVSATVVAVDSRKRKVMLTPVLMEKPLMYR